MYVSPWNTPHTLWTDASASLPTPATQGTGRGPGLKALDADPGSNINRAIPATTIPNDAVKGGRLLLSRCQPTEDKYKASRRV